MSSNTHHAEEVRGTALGINMRSPIVNGCLHPDPAIGLLNVHTHAKMIETLQDGKEKLDNTLRKSQSILDKAVNRGEQALVPVYPSAHDKLIPVDEKCDTRVSDMSLSKLSGENDYYRLTFTRANGE